jgi:hypothetical protein
MDSGMVRLRKVYYVEVMNFPSSINIRIGKQQYDAHAKTPHKNRTAQYAESIKLLAYLLHPHFQIRKQFIPFLQPHHFHRRKYTNIQRAIAHCNFDVDGMLNTYTLVVLCIHTYMMQDDLPNTPH